jgi:hypothetical protein
MHAIDNGWKPIFSDDGSKVAFGNGFTRVMDVASGQISDFGGVDGDVTVGSRWPCGWFQGAPVMSEQAAGNQRILKAASQINTQIQPTQCPGYRPALAVVRGHVVSSLGGEHFIDGVQQAYPEQNPRWDIDDFNGDFYLYKETDAVPWPVVVRRRDGGFVRRIHVPASNARVFTAPNGEGWVFANVEGTAQLFPPDGSTVPAPPGEYRGVLTWKDGELLVWTVTIDSDMTPVVLGRPFSNWRADTPAIQLRGLWYGGLEVAVASDGFHFAGYFDGPGGRLFVDTVPFNAPRAIFARHVPPLESLPASLPAMLAGYLGGVSESPGNVGGAGSTKNVLLEGFKQQGEPWFTAAEEPRLRVLFVDPQESHAPDVELTNALRAQERTGAWLNFYCDRPRVTDDVLQTARRLKSEGRGVLLGLRAYPTGPTDTAEEIASRLQADIDRFKDEFKLTVYAPAYDQSGFWSTIDNMLVRKALRAICTVVRANAGSIVGLFFFGWKRAPILMPIEQDVAEICAAIPAPDLDTMLPKWTRPAAAAPAAPGAQTPPPASPTGARTTPKPAPDPGAAPPISLPPRPSLLDRLRKLRDGG